MPQETKADDNTMPNRASNMEKAEGSRDTVQSDTDTKAEGGGISNRPSGEEVERQQNLPPRGDRKGDSHA